MILYLDTSSLLKLLLDEPGSATVTALADAADVLASSRIAYAEARAALARAWRAQRLTDASHRAVVAAFEDTDAGVRVQRILQNEHLKVATTTDLCGLELCAALKNVYAIALGVSDGLGHGTNTKAFIVSVALDEMGVICSALGGKRETVYGLAGLGDLITTGYSEHSRNRRLGEMLGTGGDWRHFLRTNTVEGVAACRAVTELIEGKGLRVHLLATIREVLFAERPAPEAMRHFFREFSYG